MDIRSMYHLRRINFHNHVHFVGNNNNYSINEKSTATKLSPSEINDGDEPTKNSALRANSTYILLDKSTKIGRNPELVDVVLHSHVHSNMISRSHSEIFVEFGNYYITDTSLNGTYVNDYRAPKRKKDEPPYRYKKLLREGDIIKFGHVNGAAINEGEHAPQESADFIFKFERAIPGHQYFGYTKEGVREHREGTRAYMQINSDKITPYDPYASSPTSAVINSCQVLPQAQLQQHITSTQSSQQQSQQSTSLHKILETPLKQQIRQQVSNPQQQQLVTQHLTSSVSAARNILVPSLPTGVQAPTAINTITTSSNISQPTHLKKHPQMTTSTPVNSSGTLVVNQQPHSSLNVFSAQRSSQQQFAAAAAAVAANLNSEEITAQLRQIMASAVTTTIANQPNNGDYSTTTSNGADSLSTLNPLFYLSRLQQQHSSNQIYNGGIQAAAAAAYLNPNLWSNVNLSAFRNVLQPTNTTDWMQLAAQQQPGFTASLYSSATSNTSTTAVAAALQEQSKSTTIYKNNVYIPQQKNNESNCATTCSASTSAAAFATSNCKSSISAADPLTALPTSVMTTPNSISKDINVMTSFLPSSLANLTPLQQQNLIAAAAQQHQQQHEQQPIKSNDSIVSSWSLNFTAPSTMTTCNISNLNGNNSIMSHSNVVSKQNNPHQLHTGLASVLPSAMHNNGSLSTYSTLLSHANDTKNNSCIISQQQHIANVIAAAAAANGINSAQVGKNIYSSLIPTTSSSNELLAAAAAVAANDNTIRNNTVVQIGRIISQNNNFSNEINSSNSFNTPSKMPFDIIVPLSVISSTNSSNTEYEATTESKNTSVETSSTHIITPNLSSSFGNGSSNSNSQISSFKEFEETFRDDKTLNSLAAKCFDNENVRKTELELAKDELNGKVSNTTLIDFVKTGTLQTTSEFTKIDGLATLKDAAASLVDKVTMTSDTEKKERPSTIITSAVDTNRSLSSGITSTINKDKEVKTMECDSSVPSPPKMTEKTSLSGNGNFTKLETIEDPSSPTLSSSSASLSPLRAPCPKLSSEDNIESEISKRIRKSPSNVSLPGTKRKDNNNQPSNTIKTYKSTENDTSDEINIEKRKKKQIVKSNDNEKDENNSNQNSKSKAKSVALSTKRNEVERLLHDLTAGNCSWMYQASRQNANKRLVDSTTIVSGGAKSLRLDEKKKRELLRKKSHKLMRQISDESSDDDESSTVNIPSTSTSLSDHFTENRKSDKICDHDSDASMSSLCYDSNDMEIAVEKSKKKYSAVSQQRRRLEYRKSATSEHQNILLYEKVQKTRSPSQRRASNAEKNNGKHKKDFKRQSLQKSTAKRKLPDTVRKKAQLSSNLSEDDSIENAITSISSKKTVRSQITKIPSTKKTSQITTTTGVLLASSKRSKKNKKCDLVKMSSKSNSDSLSNGVIDEWYFHDPERSICAHVACRKPQDDNVNWAACDACDKWFHTLCALGSNVELSDDTDFRCGCRTQSGVAETVPQIPHKQGIL